MKILYGIQGTGNGHVTRSTLIIDKLQQRGASVDVLFSGCTPDKIYEQHIIRRASFFNGFTFSFRAGAVCVADTIRQLSMLRFAKDVRSVNAGAFDLIITDFEPITALAAKIHGVPSIGIGHQYAFLYDIPMADHGFWPLILMRYFASAGISVGLHWHHFNQPVIPPVITDNTRVSEPVDQDLILVYLPFEKRDHIVRLLGNFSGFRFSVYAGDALGEACQTGHIVWNRFSKTGFYRDLARCTGVICNAGFELPSEALFLGKKLLVRPLKGQFEQVSNALALDRLGLGCVMETLDRRAVAKWLDRPGTTGRIFPEVADLIAQWIMSGDWADIRSLVTAAWR